MTVTVQDRSIGGNRESALGHGLHEGSVRLLRALEGEDLLSLNPIDNERVDLVVPDRSKVSSASSRRNCVASSSASSSRTVLFSLMGTSILCVVITFL